MSTYVQCRICGAATSMTGTKLCDRCWELETRIQAAPKLAAKILAALNPVSGEPDDAPGSPQP